MGLKPVRKTIKQNEEEMFDLKKEFVVPGSARVPLEMPTLHRYWLTEERCIAGFCDLVAHIKASTRTQHSHISLYLIFLTPTYSGI